MREEKKINLNKNQLLALSLFNKELFFFYIYTLRPVEFHRLLTTTESNTKHNTNITN